MNEMILRLLVGRFEFVVMWLKYFLLHVMNNVCRWVW